MINAISGYNPYTSGVFGSYSTSRTARALEESKADQSGVVANARKVHQPETPVQPVTPVRPVSREDPAQTGLLLYNSDPVEMAVRMRIGHAGDARQGNAADAEQARAAVLPGTNKETAPASILPGANPEEASALVLPEASNPGLTLPGTSVEEPPAVILPGSNAEEASALNLPGAQEAESPAVSENKSAQEIMEEGECQTCEDRKYQDGSDDPGVSFKTPTNIAPEQAASAVRGHENEHVVREQAKAQREDRKVVSQSVTYHTSICPECGKVYVSGGTTRTVTKADNSQQMEQQNQNQNQDQNQQNPRVLTFALA